MFDQFQNSTGFNTEHENTCPFLSFIGSSILTLYSHLIINHLIARKNFQIFITFLSKIHYIFEYQIYKKLTVVKIPFSFFFNIFTVKLNGNTFVESKCHFFQLENFVSKTTFNFHSFNKFNDFVPTHYAATIFYLF